MPKKPGIFEDCSVYSECSMEGSKKPPPGGATTHTVFAIKLANEKDALEEYNPYEHRCPEKPTSNLETLFHLLKGSLGTGILAMHNAFMQAGYIIGFIGVLVIAAIYTHCMHILRCIVSNVSFLTIVFVISINLQVSCNLKKYFKFTQLEKYKNLNALDYVMHVLNWLQVLYQIGTLCVYIVFIAKNLQEVVSDHVETMGLRMYMVIIVVPLVVFLVCIRDLKTLAPFSTAGNVITFVGFAIVLYYMAVPVDGVDGGGDDWGLPPISERNAVGSIRNMPLFFGMVLFALDAIGVVMPLENNMKTPKGFGGYFGVLNQAMGFIGIFYAAIGFIGYIKYGDDCKGSITLNIPRADILAQSVKVMLSAAMCVTFALQAFVAIDILWNFYLKPRLINSRWKWACEVMVRTTIVVVCFLLAYAIPNLELFISLFGAFCLSCVGLIYPAIVQSFTFWYIPGSMFQDSPSTWEGRIGRRTLLLGKNALLLVFAVFGMVIGSYTSIRDIADEFS
ncbi:hypothetical protein J437_LFUL013023 [Ladona fulva]|uniref:Amino acid transporter transmembrane domain-containing protein n=1 Tax=Ladona fulva TaxID=123851 RepID=A0A8K0KSB5_LADFU|nr:hypothetical protein J437_LFUL013023 [Ladona fulva]